MDTSQTSERWIRLPARGRCYDCGLTRPHFYRLIADGKIKSACLKEKGKLRGIRLVWLPSVLEYIERHVCKPEQEAARLAGEGNAP